MSDVSIQGNRPRFWLATLGLACMPASVFAWVLMLDNSFLRRTALPLWVTMALGVSLGAVAAWQDHRTRTRVLAGMNVAFVALSIPLFGLFTRLPASDVSTQPEVVPAFSLPNQLGEPTSFAQVSEAGYALLIFYRGHW